MFGVHFDPIEDPETGEVYTDSDVDRLIKFEMEIAEGREVIEKLSVRECTSDDIEALLKDKVPFKS